MRAYKHLPYFLILGLDAVAFFYCQRKGKGFWAGVGAGFCCGNRQEFDKP